jgi:hypothetical protein
MAACVTVTVLVGGGAVYAQYRYGYLPGGGNYRLFEITGHHRRATALIEQIPPDAIVSAQDRLNPHVSGRRTVYIFPRVENADTVFLDVTGPAWPQHPNDVHRTVGTLMADGFGVAAAEDGYLLLRRGVATKTLPEGFYEFWRTSGKGLEGASPRERHLGPYEVDFGDVLRLIDIQVTTDSHGELVTHLSWQVLKPIGQDLRFYVGYIDSEGAILHDTLFYPPVVELWYPTSQWRTGKIVRIQTLPWTLETKRFSLVLGVFEGQDGWRKGQRLLITTEQKHLPVFEQNTLVRLGGYQREKELEWTPIPQIAAAPATPLGVHFGEEIVMDGVTLGKTSLAAGETISFQLHWRAAQLPAFDYNVFVHVLDAAGNKVAQSDGQPHDAIGLLPTTAWPVGQPVVDRQQVTLPSELATGVYQLVAGLYNWQNGERLPVAGENAGPGDAVTLAQIEIQ